MPPTSTDMMAFYPAEAPTHLIACIEGDLETLADGRLNPGVQRISLADGKVETIVRGTSSCDGIRTTAWGTVLFTEEDDAGGAYEILNPLAITERWSSPTAPPAPPGSGGGRAADGAADDGLGRHCGVCADGVVYGGDELRPGTANPDADGGAMFKFVPATPMPAA